MTVKIKTVQGYALLTALAIPATTIEPEVAHHVLVVDRSGSMYYDIGKLKQSIEQAIAVESYGNPDVLTTLISFSSQGDLTLHWNRVPVSEVMRLDQPFIKQIRALRATYLTGMSQALSLAVKHVEESETTGITLFTDGYANDPSPSYENRALAAFVTDAEKCPRLFFNAVGYRTWCDWPRLNAMTNALSGKTVQAKSFADVLGVMKDTQELLSSGCRPVIELSEPDADYIVAMVGDKVLASRGVLKLSGIGEDDEVLAWAVSNVEKAARGMKSIPKGEEWMYAVLAYANLSLGNLREAKEALFQSGNKTVYEEHKTALAPSSIAAMLTSLQGWVGTQDNTGYAMGRNVKPKHSMDDLVGALDGLPSKSAALDLDVFWKTYTRRTVKKVMGKRGEDGSIIPPRAVGKGEGPCYIRGAEWSTTEATLNLGTVRKLRLFSDGDEIDQVAHVDLSDLSEFRDYTLIGSGEMVVSELPVVILTKAAWTALKPFLPPIKSSKTFTPGKTYTIRLKDFGMVSEVTPNVEAIAAALPGYQNWWATKKMLNAMDAPEVDAALTPEQIEGLDQYHVTRSLYFSPPTTVPYADKDAAIKKGEIDQYTRYKVRVGNKDILHDGKLHSGNEALKRFFAVKVADAAVKSPKLAAYWDDSFEVASKPRSARAKYGKMDDLMEQVYQELLLRDEKLGEGEFQSMKAEANQQVDAFFEMVRPLVVELGCTGMMPDGLDMDYEQIDADELIARYSCKLSKGEKDGTFFVFDDGALILSVFPSIGEYSTNA